MEWEKWQGFKLQASIGANSLNGVGQADGITGLNLNLNE